MYPPRYYHQPYNLFLLGLRGGSLPSPWSTFSCACRYVPLTLLEWGQKETLCVKADDFLYLGTWNSCVSWEWVRLRPYISTDPFDHAIVGLALFFRRKTRKVRTSREGKNASQVVRGRQYPGPIR